MVSCICKYTRALTDFRKFVAGRVYSGGWVADREEGRGKLVTADNCAYEVEILKIQFLL